MTAILIISAVVCYLVYRHYFWKALPWPEGALVPPAYQGHRGYWKSGARENTMTAFKAAQGRGLSMIELDVRLSKDGVPVVFHDGDLKRVAQKDVSVHDCTSQELKELADAPSLEEVFLSQEVPYYLNVELKSPFIFDHRLEFAVSELIKKCGVQKRVLISSFNPMLLWRLSFYLPEVPRALLATKAKEPGNKVFFRHLWLAPYIRIHALHLDHEYVTLSELKKWKSRKIPVAFWTVNDATKAKDYLEAGALSIISDTLSGK